jgi:hypothetical protein
MQQKGKVYYRCRENRNNYKPVALRSGQTELNRIFLSPYSAARPFVACYILDR